MQADFFCEFTSRNLSACWHFSLKIALSESCHSKCRLTEKKLKLIWKRLSKAKKRTIYLRTFSEKEKNNLLKDFQWKKDIDYGQRFVFALARWSHQLLYSSDVALDLTKQNVPFELNPFTIDLKPSYNDGVFYTWNKLDFKNIVYKLQSFHQQI